MYIDKTNEVMMYYYKKQEMIKAKQRLDEEKNQTRGKEALISTEDSKVQVYVIPTDEEVMIARDTYRFIQERTI